MKYTLDCFSNYFKLVLVAFFFLKMLIEYLPILLFIIVSLILSVSFLSLSFVLSPKKPSNEKLSPYECGFEPFDDARTKFDIKFYLVALLFIIFDLEVVFLFPWAISLKEIGLFGYSSMMIFLIILTIGFIYEWKKGALEWE